MKEKEFTFRAIFFGILVGIILQCVMVYLDAVAGLDMNVSSIATMLGILLMPLVGGAVSIREVNIMQTCASAVALCYGSMTGNYMAMMLTGQKFDWLGTLIPIFLANSIGICVVSLLRNQFVFDEKLSFPQSVMARTALEKVGKLSGREARLLYLGIAVGGVISLLQNFGFLPSSIDFTPLLLEHMTLGVLVMPLILGLGYMIGSRASLCMLAAALLVNLVEAPLGVRSGWFEDPAEKFSSMQNFNLPAVIGISLCAAILPLLGQWRTFVDLFKMKDSKDETSDIPFLKILFLLIASMAAITLFCRFYYGVGIPLMIFSLLLSCFFAIITVRVQAESGLTASMALNICQIFIVYALTRNTMLSLLIPFISMNIFVLAQNTMGDLKTGQMVGSSPKKQIWAQYAGILAGSVFAVIIFYGLVTLYGLESEKFSYPVAHMYQSLISGVAESGAAEMFNLGRFGIGGAIGALLSLLGLPAGGIALALYLAPTTILGVALGGLIRLVIEKAKGKETAARFINVSTGFAIGDGVVCVIVLLVTLLS